MTHWDSENTTAPNTAPDLITVVAQMMLDNHDAFMAGRACDDRLEKRLARAAVYGAAAYEAAPCQDSAGHAMFRSICLALIDPLHPDLDYLRADPSAGAKAREGRDG